MVQRADQGQVALGIINFILKLMLNAVFYGAVVFLILRMSTFAYRFCYQVFGDVAVSEEPGQYAQVQIKKGETTMGVATKLENYSLIVDKYTFYVKIQILGYHIMPGTYIINSAMNYDEILEVITDISNSIEEEELLNE